jgi:hypothetical protein
MPWVLTLLALQAVAVAACLWRFRIFTKYVMALGSLYGAGVAFLSFAHGQAGQGLLETTAVLFGVAGDLAGEALDAAAEGTGLAIRVTAWIHEMAVEAAAATQRLLSRNGRSRSN